MMEKSGTSAVQQQSSSGLSSIPTISMNNNSVNKSESHSFSGNNRSHGYCLKWKYHPNNLLHMFNQLLLNEYFTDVVVACEGKIIKCHKMVLSACSKYFEQVFCEYPQQNSTLVILKDMKFADVQSIIEFMYQGEINVAHDRLQSLLKSAESLQVKGLADITSGGDSGAAVNPSGGGPKDENVEMGGGGMHSGAEDSNPPTPPSVCMDSEPPPRRKRGRPPLNLQPDSSMDGLINLSAHHPHMMSSDENHFDEYNLSNMLETHYSTPLRQSKKSRVSSGRGEGGKPTTSTTSSSKYGSSSNNGEGGSLRALHPEVNIEQVPNPNSVEEDQGLDEFEDDDVTEDDIQNICKMNDYIEKGGSRPQFWDEILTKKVMNAIKNKKMEMKAGAEILGVSYSTLYSRYRELYGYLKMPANQDTNFNYYQVLNLLRAGQMSLTDAAKRLNINERTLSAYLQTTITPKKPKSLNKASSSSADSPGFGMSIPHQGMSLMETGLVHPEDFEDEESDEEPGGGGTNLRLSGPLKEMEAEGWSGR